MKILFISFYFSPDLSAGSFRSSSLVKAIHEHFPDGAEIEVITTLPNRYGSIRINANNFQKLENFSIRRIDVPQHKSGILDQSISFLIFARGVLQYIKNKDYDLVYATSGRLMTAVLASYIARRLRKPLYLDIRDIFLDTLYDFLPRLITLPTIPIFSLLERYAINTAVKVNLVSAGFLPYFEKRYSSQSFAVYTNGIDEGFLNVEGNLDVKSDSKILTVLYAGNIGAGQGLEKIIPKLAAHYGDQLQFKIIGDGTLKYQLIAALSRIGCKNVVLIEPVERDELKKLYQEADILFIHLNNYRAFKKVIPSKLFEYAASGKPIWAGVSGYAAEFIIHNVTNVALFSPCHVDQAIECFKSLELGYTERSEFKKRFARERIMEEMAGDILSYSS